MTPALRTLFEGYHLRAGKLATKDFLKLIKDAAHKQEDGQPWQAAKT